MDILNYLRQSNSAMEGFQDHQSGFDFFNDVMSFKQRAAFDKNYLIPEVSELNGKGKLLAAKMIKVLTRVESQIESITLNSHYDAKEFSQPLQEYNNLLTAEVMPLVRANMAPMDREELYQLYLDISEENLVLDKVT